MNQAIVNHCPLISIITVCLNNHSGLIATFGSIDRQSIKNYEWIVVDGGSTDETVTFLRQLDRYNVIWLSEPDHGLYDAMNKGIDRARGKYLVFLNAGDEFAAPDVLEKVTVAVRESDGPDMLYGDAYERTQDETLLYKQARSHRWLWYGMFTHHQAMLYKRESIGCVRYRLQYPIGADYAFTTEVLAKAKNIHYLPSAVCIFTQGGLSICSVPQGAKDQWNIRRDILGMSLLSRICVRSCHAIMHTLKKYLPTIYRKLRFS